MNIGFCVLSWGKTSKDAGGQNAAWVIQCLGQADLTLEPLEAPHSGSRNTLVGFLLAMTEHCLQMFHRWGSVIPCSGYFEKAVFSGFTDPVSFVLGTEPSVTFHCNFEIGCVCIPPQAGAHDNLAFTTVEWDTFFSPLCLLQVVYVIVLTVWKAGGLDSPTLTPP